MCSRSWMHSYICTDACMVYRLIQKVYYVAWYLAGRAKSFSFNLLNALLTEAGHAKAIVRGRGL